MEAFPLTSNGKVALGVEIPLQELYEAGTIAEMAVRVISAQLAEIDQQEADDLVAEARRAATGHGVDHAEEEE